jgi:hypothetical protein
VCPQTRSSSRSRGEHLAGTAGQLQQQFEFGGGQRQLTAVAPDGEPGRVDLQRAGCQDAGLGGPRRPAQQRAHPSHELRQIERLAQIVVRPALEAHYDVDGVGARGQDQDRDTAGPADLPAHLDAVQHRQHDVQDDQIDRLAAPGGQRGATVTGGADAQSRAPQPECGHLPDGGIVLHDEHTALHGWSA